MNLGWCSLTFYLYSFIKEEVVISSRNPHDMITYLKNSNQFMHKHLVVRCKTQSHFSFFFLHFIIGFEIESSSINKNQPVSMSYISTLLSPTLKFKSATYNLISINDTRHTNG
jgi:hypothetical protein